MLAQNTSDARNTLVEQAAGSADRAIRSTQRVANEALDGLADSVQDLREQAIPKVERASALARQGIDAVRDGTHQLGERARHAADSTRAYVQDEPLRSLLVAAATGAALMALLAWLGGSRRRA